jgi:hypothetical protein
MHGQTEGYRLRGKGCATEEIAQISERADARKPHLASLAERTRSYLDSFVSGLRRPDRRPH